MNSLKYNKNCIKCNKQLIGFQRKFCCRKCIDSYYYKTKEAYRTKVKALAKARHDKLKDNPEFKLYQKKKYQEWVMNHKEKFNNYMREYMREYAREQRLINKAVKEVQNERDKH